MEDMFRLSQRKGSAKWQVRKRWPADVAALLKGEFNFSTGEEEKKAAQARLPSIAAEYERRVREARDKLSASPRTSLTEAESHRMAADFYRTTLPAFIVTRQVDPVKHQELLAETRQRLKLTQAALGRNDYWAVVGIARTMAKQAGLAVEDDDPSMDHLRRMLMRAFVGLHEAAVAHLEGDAGYTPRDSMLAAPPLEEPSVSSAKAEGRTMEALLDAYEAEKSPKWSGSSKKAAVPVFRFLRSVFAGRAIGDITREDARAAVKLAEGLPVNLGKRKELAGLSIVEAVVKTKALGLPTIQPKTVNDGYVIHFAAIFNWARKEQWIASSPFEGLSVHDPVDDRERRDPFSAHQLQTLFSSAPWNTPWSADSGKAGDYWVPLLCLFHGLRNGEAAGLRVEDIGKDDGIAVLRVRAYGEKGVKNKDARGTLPLHPEVIRMGFLDHVERRKEAGETLLFTRVAPWLRAGRGFEAQYVESIVADGVISALTTAGIPSLPIHDSFIVPASSEALLGRIMAEVYRDELARRSGIAAYPVIAGWSSETVEREVWGALPPV